MKPAIFLLWPKQRDALAVARVVGLTGFLLSALYYATWIYWRWSSLPAVPMLVLGCPWSATWLLLSLDLLAQIPREFKYFANALVLSTTFSLNCALLALLSARFIGKRKYA